ncbi:MAG: aminoglycoside phosphotransferase family protein [Myxococcota bacterium]
MGADATGWLEDVRRVVREALGCEPEAVEPLAGALGLRRFARVTLPVPPGRLVARVDAPEDPAGRPPGIPPEPALEPVRALFERGGLPVARRLGGDAASGIELLEDLGETSLARLAPTLRDAERRALYTDVCGLIPRIQALPDPGDVPAFQRHMTDAYFAYKADLFCRHSLSGAGDAARRCVRDAFAAIGREIAAAPQRLAHRDLQSENVLVRDVRGERRLGLIDLQGALCTAPEYDLVCLLRDSYVELPPDEIAAHFETTRDALPDVPDPETSAQRFDLLTLTRKGKDHARFLYAAETRGDRRYLPHLPATVRHLKRAARDAARRDPGLADLRDVVEGLSEDACGR